MNDKQKKTLGNVLKMVIFLGIGFFFIYWFLLKLEPEQKAAIWQSFKGADYLWVLIAMLVCLLSHLLRALRWQLLYKPIGYSPSLNNTFGSVMVAYLANLAFPRAGEVLRCATMTTSESIPVEKSLGTVVTERIIDFLAFAVVVLVGLLVMFGKAKDWLYDTLSAKFNTLPNMYVIIEVLVGLLILAALIYFLFWKKLLRFNLFRKIDELVRNMLDGVKSILHLGSKGTTLFIVYSLAIYFLYIIGGLVVFQAFDETKGLGLLPAFVVYIFITVGMTFSQGGIGVCPVLAQLALAIYGISVEEGTACGWMIWGAEQVVVIIVGAAYMVYFSLIKRKQKHN